MSLAPQSHQDLEDRLDLATVIRTAWQYKVLILVSTFVCTLGAVIYGLQATPIFKAEIVVTDARSGNMGAAGSLMSQLGGLASLGGLNLSPEMGASQQAHAVLRSRNLLEEFVKRNKLQNMLLGDTDGAHTMWRAVESFRKQVAITEDKLKGITTVTVRWKDPKVAARWGNDLIALANEMLRVKALDEASRNIAYLKDQLAKTNVMEMQRVMYDLIEAQTKTVMLANGREEYGFTVVDPAVPAEIRDSPKRTLLAMLGFAFGAFIGLMGAFAHQRTRAARAQARSGGLTAANQVS